MSITLMEEHGVFELKLWAEAHTAGVEGLEQLKLNGEVVGLVEAGE
jgi:hypothetical protein